MSSEHIPHLPSFKKRWSSIDLSDNPIEYIHFMDIFRPEEVDTLQGYQPYRSIANYLRLQEGYRVLDVGCGTGGAARALASLIGNKGRVMAFWMLASTGMLPFAQAAGGLIATAIGPQALFMLSGGIVLLGAIFGGSVPALRQLD